MLEFVIHLALSIVPFMAWASARSDREEMRGERDNAVAEATMWRAQTEEAIRLMNMANDQRKVSEGGRDRLVAELLERMAGTPSQSPRERDSRAIKTLQAELAEARRVLSEHNLLQETHKGGNA